MTWHDRVGWWVFLERGNSESCYTAEAGETVAALPPVFLLASTWFFHISVSVSLDTVFIYESLYIYIYVPGFGAMDNPCQSVQHVCP